MRAKKMELLPEPLTALSEIKLRSARLEDARRIQMLYAEVYGQHYTIPIVYDRGLMCRAIEGDSHFWLVGEHKGRIIASLVYSVDTRTRIAKALGAVVSKQYRKNNLANMMMKIILDKITREHDLVDVIYATTRTVTTAPQQMTDTMGFVPLGIFPNAHKIFDYETHCLAAYYVKKSWELRQQPAMLLPEIKPFYDMVDKELAKCGLRLGKPKMAGPASKALSDMALQPQQQPLMDMELVNAPVFVQNRLKTLGNSGVFAHAFVPFHEPNLMLISHDQKNEIYVHCAEKDRYSVIVGGRAESPDLGLLLKSAVRALNEKVGVSYVELMVDAYSPRLQRHALNALFLPSAYFPGLTLLEGKRQDHIVFSRSFDMLDFRNVNIMPAYRKFLRVYLTMWRELYIDSAFRTKTSK